MARNQSSDLRRNLYGNKIFKKILTENALEYLAFGENFIMDRLTGSTSSLIPQHYNLTLFISS